MNGSFRIQWFIFSAALTNLTFLSAVLFFQYEFLHVSIILIAGRNHFITRLQTRQHFIIIRVLPAQLYIYTVGSLAIISELEHPIATGLLVKSTLCKQQGLSFITERKPDLQGLSATNAFRDLVFKLHIHLEATIVYLGINFIDLELIIFPGEGSFSHQPDEDPRDIMLVDVNANFITTEHIDLAK